LIIIIRLSPNEESKYYETFKIKFISLSFIG